ncbi:GPP34 family phosphoprotein [Streptomyces sp. AC563]|nr:GPP34 family phosphoprotein [Streptomyces buecherae]
MSPMAGSPPQPLSLPEEFVLLSHLETGRVHETKQTSYACAAAELGELALRRALLVRPRKTRKLGIEFYGGPGEMELLDPEPTGLGWADALLAELVQATATAPKPVTARRWLRRRGSAALSLHRAALTERGLLHHRPGALFRKERYYPERGARDALINVVRAAYDGRGPLDAHLLFLCQLVESAQLKRDFGLTRWRHQHIDSSRVPAPRLPEDLRDTFNALRTHVPSREE